MSEPLTTPQKMRVLARAHAGANSAIAADQLDGVRPHVEETFHLIREGPLAMGLHATLITSWTETALLLQQRGRADLAAECRKVADLLQARLDAGEYTREIFGAR
jgi:hypothetical protein